MKYLFQQMLAFWIVILMILLIVGLSFTQFMKQSIIYDTYAKLEGYAKNIQNNSKLTPNGDVLTVNSIVNWIGISESILFQDDVQFYYVDANQKFDYPKNYKEQSRKELIPNNVWKKVQKGRNVQTTIHWKSTDTDVVMVLMPLKNLQKDKFAGAIVVMQPLKNTEQNIQVIVSNLLKGFLLSTIVALFVSYVLAKFQVNRINRMRAATRQVAQGNFDIYLAVKNNDELDELAEDFNQMAESLKQSHEEIERQEDLRRQFMADVAHEMRTPLTTINGMLEGFAYDVIPEDQKKKGMQLLQNETNRLIRLVNENLDYEKIRTNQISMVIQKFDAAEALSAIVDQLATKAEQAGNQLILSAVPKTFVHADYDRFVQIIVNIVQNAIQFTQNGTITVSLERGYLETSVRIEDTGIGMSKEEVQNIWDRYYKVDPSRKNTKYGESGLGLAIVDQLVRLHKGKVDVVSEKGKGTTFTVTFPDKVEASDSEK